MSPRPPSLLRRLLAWILPSGPVGDGLSGDLDELYAERAERGRLRANLWYARQVLSAAVRYASRSPARLPAGPTSSPRLGDLGPDLRQACRALRRRPGFTAVVVSTLALGIGATTSIFSVVDGVLLRPLPYPDSDRVVRVLQYHRDDRDVTVGAVSREELADLQAQVGAVYESLAGFATGTRVLTGVGDPVEIPVAYVTSDFFHTLDASAARGRLIGGEEGGAREGRATVLSHGFWRSRFGSDPDVIGSTVTLDGAPFTVLGVLPPTFDYPSPDTDVFLPVSLVACDDVPCSRASRFLQVIARLARDATVATASEAASSLFERLAEAYPEANGGRTATVIPLRESLVGDVRRPLVILLGAVGFLLLIACANVANLGLARGSTRSREFAIRAAMGAGRLRVMRYVLTESVLLASLGGTLGFLLAVGGVDALVALGGGSIPRAHVIGADLRIAGFALLTSLATGALFGVIPAVAASRVDVQDRLKAGGPGAPTSARRMTSRGLLVGAQTALAVILVTGAALLVRSFWKLTHVDAGFVAENVLSVGIRTDADVMSGQERDTYRREIVRRVGEVPGVVAVGGAKDVPLQGITEAYSFSLPGRPDDSAIDPQTVIVTGDYFEALGIALLAGRRFTPADEVDESPVVIVNEALAERYWGDGEAVGADLHLFGRLPVEIVGVVGNVRHGGIAQPPVPAIYVLPHFGGRADWTIFVRTATDPLPMADEIRRAVWAVNPNQALEVATMSQVRSTTVAQPRFLTVLLGGFAGLAMVLATLGVYGVTAYEVSRRTHEVGVRIALGARTSDVLRWIFARGAVPLVAGVAIGLVAARALTGILSSLLYEVEATDLPTLTTVPLALAAAGLLAIFLPASRAARVDPNVALRSE